MQEIIEKLIILRDHGNMDTAIEAGEQIIEELRHLTGRGNAGKSRATEERSVMAARPTEDIVKALKEIIDKNGLNYLEDEPFQVYTELIRSGNADLKTAAAFLHLLTDGLLECILFCCAGGANPEF